MFEYPKKRCIGCDSLKFNVTKEHIFAKWLILKTKTNKTGIKWFRREKVSPLKCTIPLCKDCNRLFGEKLEGPVSNIFDNLENNRGISEDEAELLVRWLWKITGLSWVLNHPNDRYTKVFTVRQRILRPLDEQIRKNLLLAISLIKDPKAGHRDLPMGIDSTNEVDAIFASGVFSKVALLVSSVFFEEFIPTNFLTIKFKEKRDGISKAKVFYPKIGFLNGDKAIINMIAISNVLSVEHDELAMEMRKRYFKTNRFARKIHKKYHPLKE